MMGLWAAQDWLQSIKAIKEDAVKSLYEMEDKDATEAKLGQIRGTLKTVAKIERDLDFILSWKEES